VKKLFDKDEVWFAVGWIVVYVLCFGNADTISESIGIPKLLTCVVGLVLTALLLGFVFKWDLKKHVGLVPMEGNVREYLYFIPLIIISTVNFWNGVTMNVTPLETALYILSMVCVGILEELIFRGLLFKGMSKENVTAAIIVSSLTFGMGHIVNLLYGAPLLDTLLQLVYASGIGFCYTAIFLVCGSIWPCIVSHIFVNSTSVFAVAPGETFNVITAVFVTLVCVVYGLWLMKKYHRKENDCHGL